MAVDESAFGRFVTSLPRSYELDLVTSDTVSTAFYQALSTGWTETELKIDAERTLARGAGVGAVVSRFRTLAATKPVGGRGEVVSLHSGPATQVPGYCPCGVAPAHPVTVMPAEWMLARAALLRRIDSEHIDSERAEALMASLIADERDPSPLVPSEW